MSEEKKSNKLSLSIAESLFKPSADYLGGELKSYLQERIEKAKANRREQNLFSHVESVHQKAAKQPEKDLPFEQLELFGKWADSVEKVDPRDKELSDIWHNLLLNSDDSFNSEILMDKLNQISSGDAKVLFKINHKKRLTREDRYRIKKLMALELVERDEFRLNMFTNMVLFIGGGSCIGTIFLALQYLDISQLSKYWTFALMLVPVAIVVGLTFVISKLVKGGFGALVYNWSLSWIGLKLVNLGK
ncbi:hypothetical protein CSW98_08515 [Vibrio sp. HA2012]|uniref:hypothetical protein n=1 Tax=Vibrio sp. HA2012 TaxID=1971595 RepID=UPI000C2CCCCB|nr:hypothetical protein [Vibrio sp. HA2012]PJC87009.1 hypothetical protein CSW98_08515 [Vibrio sp. HA2012]